MGRLNTFSVSLFMILVGLASLTVAAQDGRTSQRDRKGRLLSIFQIVTFPNDPCFGTSKNGTCYTAAECSQRGGVNAGSCANGFGVCCTLTVNCGGRSSENCTYFDSNVVASGACAATICPCSTNICQLRLDFVNFVISGPSTVSTSSSLSNKGVISANGATSISQASQCLTDSFSVSNPSGQAPPVICGTNTGQHMYVDANNACNVLTFALGSTGQGTAIAARSWSIKVSQYSCNYPNLAPSGCTQYFFGATTNTVQSYNYNGGNGQHLANQNQAICVRRERAQCRICFYAVNVIDFAVSGKTAASGVALGTACCSYAAASASKGFDCVVIPGAVNTAGAGVGSNVCGRNKGLVTPASTGSGANVPNKSICTNRTPFLINFRSDAFETAIGAISEAKVLDAGFMLGFTMDAINCIAGASG